MKIATLICSLAGLVLCGATSTAYAQCGCGHSAGYAPAVSMPMSAPSYHAHPGPPALPAPAPRMSGSMPGAQANVAFVNQLATPVPRANYSLNYAIHLTDGRILLSDFVPAGQTVRGIETQSGTGGRRLNTAVQGAGTIAVTDPTNNRTVTTFSR